MSTPQALINGAPAPDLSLHRGLHYGDGVFRTCMIYGGEVLDIHDQCQLVLLDAARLGLTPVPATELMQDAAKLAQGQARAVLKMTLLRGGTTRGYRPEGGPSDRLVCRYPAPDYPAASWQRGVTALRSDFRLASQPVLAGIKHLNRLEQVLASRDWPPGVDEALLSDDAGRPVCGTRTNLFWVRDGALRTPALERCGVAGFMRRKVLALAQALKVRAQVGDGQWEEVEAADELFLTNSLIGIWPVAQLGSRRWQAPGPLTGELMQRLAHPRLVRA